MSNLLTLEDPLQEGYSGVYEALSRLREGFHRSGRADDSNAKLDEVSKLFATYLAFKKGQIGAFPDARSMDLIQKLQRAFATTAMLPQYQLPGDRSIFGPQPSLALQAGDEVLAGDLVRLVSHSINVASDLRAVGHPFDVLNEAFGHFVRDNFRSNIEDAQYMTPPEVVNFMADIVLHDVGIEDQKAQERDSHWTVLDPSCGVGSFLAALYDRARHSSWLHTDRLRLFGQDKVERMVRLSTINLELFDVEEHRITLGNSLEVGSPIDQLNGVVDIILTNPPFGARFEQQHVANSCQHNTPFFSSLQRTPRTIDSELLFIDRCMRLLRDGGLLLIVVPDSVISAKGISALLRRYLAATATLRAVIELPSVTFAQAGTRTKTAILYLQKGRSKTTTHPFLAVSKDLGFRVSSRKGVQIKVSEGENELPLVRSTYCAKTRRTLTHKVHILRTDPSCVIVPELDIFRGSWTPSHYSSTRLEMIRAVSESTEFESASLAELVDFCSNSRRREVWRQGWAFISVLHILGEGFVDIGGVFSYSPKTPGIPVESGDLLISRINPRIPRVCVTPDLGVATLCSSEFEVMRTKGGLDVYTLAYLLQTEVVQSQIRSLTSGTSASHNRIRTSDLAKVMLPLPRKGTKKAKLIGKLIQEYRSALESLRENSVVLARIRTRDPELFGSSMVSGGEKIQKQAAIQGRRLTPLKKT